MDICAGRIAGAGNCVADSELAELEGGYKKSGGGTQV